MRRRTSVPIDANPAKSETGEKERERESSPRLVSALKSDISTLEAAAVIVRSPREN